jgi:tripartite-type tricarboxylate transporter receptor subunit TctC
MGVRSVGDLAAVARRQPEGLAYGSPGHGSPQHLAGEMFKAATGANLRHVPYLGTIAALTGLLSGQIDVMFADLAPVLAHVRSQRVVALGVTSRARQPSLPEVPCLADVGVAGLAQFEALGWQSLVAPAGTPGEVVDRFNRLLVQWIDQPAVRERLQREGLEPRTGTPEQLAATIRTETDRWAKIIKAARVAVD